MTGRYYFQQWASNDGFVSGGLYDSAENRVLCTGCKPDIELICNALNATRAPGNGDTVVISRECATDCELALFAHLDMDTMPEDWPKALHEIRQALKGEAK